MTSTTATGFADATRRGGPLLTLLAILSLTALAPSTALCGTTTSTAAPTPNAVEHGIEELLFVLSRADGFGPSAVLNATSLSLTGEFRALAVGVGLGCSYKFGGPKYPIELSAVVAPQLDAGPSGSSGAFAVLGHAALVKNYGVGLGWTFWQAGQWEPPHRSHLFLFVGASLF